MQWFEKFQHWVGEGNYWILQVFAVVTISLLAALVVRILLKRLLAHAATTYNLWDDAFLGALLKPINWFILLIGLSIAAQIAARVTDDTLLQFVVPLRKVGVILLLTWFLVNFISRAEANFRDPEYAEKPVDETTVRAVGKLLRMSVIITAALVMLQSLGYSISGVLAFGGIGGIAVGFAAKDLLANFFGGLMIYMDRPFSVGDWVRSPDQEIEGTVEDIGWRLTRIRTFDKRPLYIPNSTFTHISLENPSRMTNRRIKETIGVRYDDAERLPGIIAEVKEYLSEHDDIDHNLILMVNFDAYAASSLNFFIYTFTKTTDWKTYHEIKQGILFDILKIIARHGAECAFPTSTLHVPDPVQVDSVVPRAPVSDRAPAADSEPVADRETTENAG